MAHSFKPVSTVREPWWEAPKDEAHDRMIEEFKRIDSDQAYRTAQNQHHLRLYSQRMAIGYNHAEHLIADTGNVIKLNVVQSVIDTAVSHIATTRTRPRYSTIEGDWEDRRKAKWMNRISLGQFFEHDQYTLDEDVFRDGAIFGTGVEWILPGQDRVIVERGDPEEIVVSDYEAKYGSATPRTLYRHKEVLAELLIHEYPKKRLEIENAQYIRDEGTGRGMERVVSTVEAYHLPSGKNAKDGRRVWAVTGCTLEDEEWTLEHFPAAFWRYQTSPRGFYGMGLAEMLNSIQIEINFLLHKIQRNMTYSVPHILMQKNSSVSKQRFTNHDMPIIEYTGMEPKSVAPIPISPFYSEYLESLEAKAFRIAGISQMSAQGMKIPGLNSGEAQRVHSQITSKRHQHIHKRWDKFRLDVAARMMDAGRLIEDRTGKPYEVMGFSDNGLTPLKLKDCVVDHYRLTAFPTNLLPDTPEGQLETLKEAAQISPEFQQQLMQQLDAPDVKAAMRYINSPMELADKLIEQILDHGEKGYEAPDNFMNLQVAISRFNLAYLSAKVQNAPEDRLELLRQWIVQADSLIKKNMQPDPSTAPAMPGAAPPVAPGAAPMAQAAAAPPPTPVQ